MATAMVIGAQWGDEGKGKIVDYLAASLSAPREGTTRDIPL